MKNKCKLLIIGGTGFFGKSILDLFNKGCLDIYGIEEINILARRTDEFARNYPELINEKIKLISADISACSALPVADLVIHAASSADARDYLADASKQKNNIEESTANYCRLAKIYHKEAKIVYCSSGAVYGQQPADVEFISEEFAFQDVSEMVDYKRHYALGKRASELTIQNLGLEGLNVSIARCFAFYGKYLPKGQHFAYGNFVGAAEQGKTIEVQAKHRVIRSYMHADDMVHALIQIALDAKPECPIYNIGSDEAIELRDLAKKIAVEYNVGVNIAEIQNNYIDRYVPSTSRLLKLNARSNFAIINNINNSRYTLLVGCGIHAASCNTKNVLNNWAVLLEEVANELKLPSIKRQSNLLSYKFEDLVTDYCYINSVAAHVAEDKLKVEIARKLNDLSSISEYSPLNGLLAKLNPSQILSLNVDRSIVDMDATVTISKTKSAIPFETMSISKKIPVWFLNGIISKPTYMNFGMRSLANQIEVYDKQFSLFKALEKKFDYDKEEIIKNDKSWFSTFIYNPVLIVGASVGEHELALRYLLNQRKRNFACHPEHRTPVYIVLDKKSYKKENYSDDLLTLGVEPIVFENYQDFWQKTV